MIETVYVPSGVEVGLAALPHILFVVDQLPKALGGGERIAVRLAALLPRYGYRASILTFDMHPDCPLRLSAPCPIYLLPMQRTYGWRALKSAFALSRFVRDKDVKVVQTFFESSNLWAGLIVKMFSRARLIWSQRDMGILRVRKHKIAYRLLSRMPDRVFAVSEEVRKHCIRVDRIAPDKVTVIYNGIDVLPEANTADPPRPEGRAHITTLGNIRRVKGHDVFIEAAALLATRFPHSSYSIGGAVLEQDYFANLQATVASLGLSDRFSFVGPVHSLPEHLAQADIFVMPSRSEGFSNAIIEAMAAALPVVATHVGGNAEAVVDLLTGLIVPPEDPVALAEALASLLSDPTRAAAMGEAGRSLAKEKFTTDAMMRQTTATYADLLDAATRT